MTTNHPEKLDPALIRPGRINKKVRTRLPPFALHPGWLPHYRAAQGCC